MLGLFCFGVSAGVGIGTAKWAPPVLAALSVAVLASVIALGVQQFESDFSVVVAVVAVVLVLNGLALRKLRREEKA